MKKLKIPLTIVFLILINLLYKSMFLGISPNSISLKEIDLLMKIGITPGINNYFFRLIPVVISSLISLFTFLFIYKKSKQYLLSLIISLILVISPWLYISSRYLNLYLPILFFSISIFLIFPNRIAGIITAIVTTLYTLIFINSNFSSTVKDMPEIFKSFITLIDFRTLFFQGDPTSRMFHTPLTGFFLYVDFAAFIAGLYFVYIKNILNDNLFKSINIILIIGLLLFVLAPYDELISVKAIGIFYFLSLIIGCGYYYLITFFKNRLHILRFVFISIALVNLIFFLELFFFHFDKYNSYEWGYAEKMAIIYVNNHPKTSIYLTDESNKINRFYNFFYKKSISIIPLSKAPTICRQSNTECIIREHELKIFGLEKDQSKMKFSNYDGLPVYFLL